MPILANSLTVEGVHAGYGAVRVIEDVSLTVGHGETVALLSGALPARTRRSALAAIASGEIRVVVGTQALFQEVIASVNGAPSHYRSRQGEWLRIAKQHLK